MIKDMLVHLSVGEHEDVGRDYAVALAAALGAHATAVAFAYEPAMGVGLMGTLPSNFIEAQRAENEGKARQAQSKFEEAARLAGVSAESHVLSGSVTSSADQFGRMARRFDLAVVMQARTATAAPEELITEAALFQSGRPVVVVPYIHKGGLQRERAMVCWDGGRTAARAIGDALPLLALAKQVNVVMVTGEEGKRDVIPGADMGQHLARHGLNVEVQRIVASGDVQTTLLSHAADISADFLVMGGYGHSRIREFILGGVTRGMLASMTVPCLMSH